MTARAEKPADIAADHDGREAWCESAREYHADRGHRANIVWNLDREDDRKEAARLRRLIADSKFEGLLSEFSRARPTPQVTVEAIMSSVREHGVAALKNDPNTAERFGRCDAAARQQIKQRIEKLFARGAQS
jgi:hypothetical protein